MKYLEELQMNAVPALQTTLYDGWIMRFADGYSNRANSVNPIYPSCEDVQKKIEICEVLFKKRHLKPTYKITPFIYPEDLDTLLEKRGYQVIHRTSIQTLVLDGLYESTTKIVKIDSDISDEWFDHFCSFNSIGEKKAAIYRKMLDNLITTKFFVSMLMDDEIIACGMAVLENDYYGLFDITVKQEYRHKGYGTQLIAHMLKNGKEQGAKTAYLQVMLDNPNALGLYKKFGFEEQYQYYYRVLP